MKRKSAEDGALGTSLRPRTASSSVNGGGNSSNSGSTPSSSNNGGISSVVSGAGSSVNGGVGSSSSESVKITKLEKRIQQLNEQAKKYKATIEDLKRKRQEDALTIQSCKKQCERHDASMQQTKKLVLDFHNSILSMDIFEVKEGTYWITFEGVEKGVPSTKVNDMLKRKQPNVVIEQLIIIFSLGTVTTQQFRALDLIMTRICPLMKESKHRLKNFKDRKSKLFNRKAVDDGTTARAKVVLVDEDSNSTVLLQDAEQNTDISTDGIVNNNNNMNIDNNIELNEECDEVLPCGDDDDVGIIN
ncbi:predicted protein [Naegleria gruberi]|uniref:Predicted protein n=2 Tax=Naegleria gruberi TaxID=5762 RepID=D2W587_NAEGR|nr:uncharacterized protein NAEGRDRAFT_54757 [Naegleria gruberi]EFC35762.1 predicted protein [Naegleria gruberi]|eukprot:XP_002668506.1 predicted protein [Naegleria gruberi strain NEG-M]